MISSNKAGTRPVPILGALLACAAVAGGGPLQPLEPQEPQERPPETRNLSPDESVAMALAHSGRVRAAEADLSAARARHRQVRSGLFPSVVAQGSYSRLGGEIQETDITVPGLDTTFDLLEIERDRFQTELGMEQVLFAGGQPRNAARSAERAALAVEHQAQQERAAVALEVRTAYWTLYGARAARQAAEAALELLDEHVHEVTRRYEEGAVLLSDLLAAQARRSEVALERVDAVNAVRVAQLELNRMVGLPPGTDVVPTAEPRFEPLVGDLETFVAEATTRQPRLRSLEAEVESLRVGVAAERGGWLPEVTALGRYVYARPSPFAITEQRSFRGTWEAGVAFRWALWEGGAQGARVAEARERLSAAESRLEHAREEAGVEFARTWLEAERAAEAVAVAAEHVEQAEETLRVVGEQFTEGVALPADLLEAERTVREAQAGHARAVAEHGIARAALRYALGEAG